jgi:hypothetical protein
MGECNEIVVSLEQVKDIYKIKIEICNELIKTYDKTGRQLYNLSAAWTNFKRKYSKPNP